MTKLKIGILKPGSAPERLAASQGDYDALFRDLLQDDEFEFVTYDIENNVFPKSAFDADAWIITGSRHGVYEDHIWIAPLEKLIQYIQASSRPLVGICFGHQIIAQALGGRVERAAAGWIAGPQTYHDKTGNEFCANAWHRDQVVEAPANAEIVATGEGCSIAALRYAGPIFTLQAHPEFSPDYLLGLYAEKGQALPADLQAYVSTETGKRQPSLDYMIDAIKAVLKSGR